MHSGNPSGHTAIKSFFVNVGSLVSARLFLAVSQVLVLPIVARYLTVDEFALIAMAMSLIVFCSVLSDAGLGRSLIRTPKYDHTEWVSVFWLLAMVGSALAIVIILAAPLWAAFFGQPDLVAIIIALSLVPLFQALAATPNAEIERRENYTGIAKVQTIATTLSLGTAVLLAVLGAGVWALVAQQLVLAGVRLIGIVYLSNFRPNFQFFPALVRPHLIFARDALIVSAIAAVKAQSAVMSIGKFNGEASLGLFAMSARFSKLPQFGLVGPASTVVYVRMAKAQRDPERLVEIYLSAMKLMATLLFPVLTMIAVAGTAIFTVLLSADWAEVAPIFALSIAGLTFEAIAVMLLSCIFRATNRTDLLVRLKIESTLLYVMMVLAAAIYFDVYMVAAVISIWGLLIVPRGWILAQRIVPLRIASCLGTVALPLVVSAALAVTHISLRKAFDPNHLTEIAMAIVILGIGIGSMVLIRKQSLTEAISAFRET